MNILKFTLPLAIAGIFFVGCKKPDEPETPAPPVNEEEVFTTVILTFTNPEIAEEIFTLRSTDLDGDGGQPPVVTADTLLPGRYYNMSVTLLNESINPPVNLTGQIQAEGTEHQIFFQNTVPTLTITYNDTDASGRPIGVVNTAISGTSGEGNLTVTLRHAPDKGADGVAEGNIANAGGETDVEVEFPVVIE